MNVGKQWMDGWMDGWIVEKVNNRGEGGGVKGWWCGVVWGTKKAVKEEGRR